MYCQVPKSCGLRPGLYFHDKKLPKVLWMWNLKHALIWWSIEFQITFWLTAHDNYLRHCQFDSWSNQTKGLPLSPVLWDPFSKPTMKSQKSFRILSNFYLISHYIHFAQARSVIFLSCLNFPIFPKFWISLCFCVQLCVSVTRRFD